MMLALFPKVPKTQRPKSLKIDVFYYPITVIWHRLQGTPANICINLILPETTVVANLRYIVASDSIGLSVYFHSNFSDGVRKRTYFETECKMAVQGHPRSLVSVPIENGYATSYQSCSNLGPILLRFRDIAGILLRRATPPLFHPNFRDVPLRLDCRCCGSEVRRP